MTLGPTGGLQLARKPEHNRFSSGGTSVGVDRNIVLSKDPSIASTAEEGVGLTEGEDDGPAEREGEDEEEKAVGPFTETSLEMARLRLPHMELGFEEDGFFGIDVRSLIIGREIARGAYGVVHEGKLHPSRPRGASVEDGEQAGTSILQSRRFLPNVDIAFMWPPRLRHGTEHLARGVLSSQAGDQNGPCPPMLPVAGLKCGGSYV